MYNFTIAPKTGEQMKEFMVAYAITFLGNYGIWGGNGANPDCSGFALNILNAAEYSIPDMRAKELYRHLVDKENWLPVDTPAKGDFIFWGNSPEHIGHVDLVLNDEQVIGSIGVRPNIRDEAEANRFGAMVKIRPLTYRRGMNFILRMPEK